jgi:hypothetical protein
LKWVSAPLSLLALLSAGCQDIAGLEGSPGMNPGQNCLQCHVEGGAASFHTFSVSGTVYATPDAGVDDGVQGVEILVTDSKGTKLTLVSNSAGNFYTAEELVPPLEVAAQWGHTRIDMGESPPSGQAGHPPVRAPCNLCHTLPPNNGGVAFFGTPPGRIFVPRPPSTP